MNIGIIGKGAMGNVLFNLCCESSQVENVYIAEPKEDNLDSCFKKGVDAVIDFSNPDALDMITAYCLENRVPAVIATTGYSDDQLDKIRKTSETVPVVFSANYSLGITVMKKVLAELGKILEEDFDIEIIEKHHNKKLDAPSGTAKALAQVINGDGKYEEIYGRSGNRKRGKEIGIHAVRGGSIAGEHEVLFAGEDEQLSVTHIAGSKKIFAKGALKAAVYAKDAEPGMYSMEDVLFGDI